MVDIFTYTKNVAKSVLYSGQDVVKQNTPAMESFMSTNREVLTGLYDMAKDYRTFGKRMQQYVKSSRVYEAATEGARAIFEDISNGTFYNKERIDKFETRAMGDMANFDDFDSSNFNMDTGDANGGSDDWDFGDTDMESSPNDDVVAAVHLSSKDNAEAVAKVSAKVGANIAATNRANTMLMLNQQIKANSIMEKGFSSIFDRMGEQNAKINSSIDSLTSKALEYYDKSLTLSQDSNNMLKEVLDLMKANAGIKEGEDKNKKAKLGYSDIVDANGMPDLRAYWQSIKRNAKNALPAELKTLTGNGIGGEGSNLLLTFVSSPLKVISDTIVKTVIPKMVTKTMSEFDSTLSGAFSGMLAQFNNLAADEDASILKQYLGKIFGVKVRGAETPNPADYKKDAIPFDGITKKAITEVIPGYLRRIESALTGDGERIFSYSSGKWSNARDLRKQYTSIPESAYKSAYADIKEEMMTLILGSGKFSKTDTKSLNENMDKFLKRIVSEDMGNPRKLMSTSIKKGRELYMDYGVDNSELMELLLTALKYTSRGSRAQLAKGAFEAKESIANKIESLIKSNTEMAEIFNGSDTDKGYTWSKDGGKRTKAPGHLYNNTIDKILDDKGHNVFYYLQMMLREMATFRENRYGADMRGGRGRSGGGGGVPPIPQLSNTALTGAYAREVRRARRESISPITVSYDIENVSASRRENEARRNAYYREQEELEKYRKKKGARPVWDTGDEAAMSSIRSNIKQLSIRAHGDINHSQTNNYDNLYQYLKNSTDFKEYWDANHTILDEFIAEQRKERKDRREQNAELRGGYKNNDEENDYDETDENGNKKKKKKRKGKGIINKLLEAESLQDKMDVFSEGMDEILEAPGKYLSTIIMKADEAVYNLIFGKEGVKNNKTGKEANGILDAMVIGIQNTFEKVNNWLDEKILDPIKKKLGIETFGDAVQKFFGIFGIDFNGTRENVMEWLFKDNSIVKNIRQNIQQSWEDLMESISPGQSAQDAARAQARTDAQAVDAAIADRTVTRIASRSNRNYDIAMATGRASVPRTKAKTYENYRELERTSNGRKWIRQYCLDNGIELPLTEVNYRKLAKAEVDSSNPLPSNPSSVDKTRYQNDVRTAEARYLTRLHDIQVQIVNTYNQQKQDEAVLQDRLRPYNEDEQFKDTADKLLGKSSLGYMMRVTEEEKAQGITKVNSIDRLSELYKLGDDTTYLKLKASPVGRLFIDNYCKVHETGPIDRMSREDAKKVQRAIVEEFNNYARTGFNNMLDMIDEDITLTEGQKRGMRERIKNGNNDWAKRRGEIYNRFDVNNPNINIPMIDANGNIVRDANGNIITTTRQATDAEQARRISRLTDYKRRGLDEANAFLDLINGISGRTADNIENKSKEWNINFNAIEKGGLDADAEIRRLFDILPNEYRSRLVEGTRLLGTIRLGDTNAQMDQYNAAGSAGITKVLNELRAIDTVEKNKTKSRMGNFNKKNAEDLTTAMFNYLRTRDPEYLKDADGNFIYDEIEKINQDTGEKYISKEKRRNADYKSDSEIKAYILRDIFGTELNLDAFATEEDKNKEIDRLYRQIKVNPELLDRLKEKFKGELGFLGSLARGSRLVTKTGLYTIHKGEAVVPSEYVPRSINGQTPGGISKQKEIDDENRIKNRYLAYLGRRIGSAAESNVATEEVPENLQAQTTEVPNQNENPNKARKVRELKKFTGEEVYQKTLQPLNKILRDSMGDEAADKLKSNFEKFAAPGIGGGIVGGGVGLASSLVFGLAGGPIIGAAVGAAANIAKNSETFSKFLFGEKIEGQYDNGAQKRAGGLFSLETQEAWHKYFPSMAKWGAGSAVAGLFTPLGPIGGLMVGSAIGFIKKNDDFQGLLFGENGLFREEDKEKFKKALPAGIAGSAVGAIALSGPFGLLGGAVVGALGGIASTTETFKRIMLGKETQVGVDKDGKPIMKRQGGIIGTIAKISLEPIKQGAIFIKTTVTDFVKKDIVAPLKSAVKPIGNMFRNMFTEIKEGITGTLNNFFEKRLGVPVEEFIKDRILAPIGNTAKNILKFPFKLLGGAISLPFKALGFVGNNIRANQIKRGTDNGSTAAERLDWRDNHKIRSKKILGFGLNIDGFRKADEWINSASSADIESLRRDLSLWNDKDANYRELAKVRKEDIAGSVNEFFDDKKHGGFFTKNNHARKRILELIRDDKYEEAYKLIRTLKGRDGQPLDPQQVETLINQLQNQVQLYNDVKAGRGADANYRRTMTEKLASLGFKDTLGKTNVNKIIRMLDSEKAGRKKQGLWDEGTEEMLNQGKANTQDIVSAINALTDRTVDFYNALVNGNYTEGALSKDDKDIIGRGTAFRVNSAKMAQDKNRQKKNNRVENVGNNTINSVRQKDETIKDGFKRKFGFSEDLIKKINTNDPESVRRANELGKYCYTSKSGGRRSGISEDGIAEAIKIDSKTKYKIVEMYAKERFFPMNSSFVNLLVTNVSKSRFPILKYIISLGRDKVETLIRGNTQNAHTNFIKNDLPKLVTVKNYQKYINDYLDNSTLLANVSLRDFIDNYGTYVINAAVADVDNHAEGYSPRYDNSDYHTAVIHKGEIVTDDIPGYAEGKMPSNRDMLRDIGHGFVLSGQAVGAYAAKFANLGKRGAWNNYSKRGDIFKISNFGAKYQALSSAIKTRLKSFTKDKHPKLNDKELKYLTKKFNIDYKSECNGKMGINNRALEDYELEALTTYYSAYQHDALNSLEKQFNDDKKDWIRVVGKDEDTGEDITVDDSGIANVYDALLSGRRVGLHKLSRKKQDTIRNLLKEYTSYDDDANLTVEEKTQKHDRQNKILDDIRTMLSYNVTDDGDVLRKKIDKNGKVYVDKLDPENKKALEEGKTNNFLLNTVNSIKDGIVNIKGFFTDKVDGDRSRLDIFTDNAKKIGKYVLAGVITAGGLSALIKTIAPNVAENIGTWWETSGKPTASNVVSGVKKWATEDLPETASEIWGTVKDKLVEFSNNLWPIFGKILNSAGQGVITLTSWLVKGIPYIFQGVWKGTEALLGMNNDVSTGNNLATHLGSVGLEAIVRGSHANALKNMSLSLPGAAGKVVSVGVNGAARGAGYTIDALGSISRNAQSAYYVNNRMNPLYNIDYTEAMKDSNVFDSLNAKYGATAVNDVLAESAEKGIRVTSENLATAAAKNGVTTVDTLFKDAATDSLQTAYRNSSKNLTEEAAEALIKKQGLGKTVSKMTNKQFQKTMFNFVTNTSTDVGIRTVAETAGAVSKNKVLGKIVTQLTKLVQKLKGTALKWAGEQFVEKLSAKNIKTLGGKIIGYLADKVANGIARMAAGLASAGTLTIIFAAYDFIWPLLNSANAMEVLGVNQIPQEYDWGYRVLAGFLNCICGLPFMAFGLIPPSILSWFLFDVIGLDWFGVKELRQKSNEEYEAFKKYYGEDLTFDDYSYLIGNQRFGIIDLTAQAIGGGTEGALKRLNEKRKARGQEELTLSDFTSWSQNYRNDTLTEEQQATIESGTQNAAVSSNEPILTQISNSLNMLVAYVTGKDPTSVNSTAYINGATSGESSQFANDISSSIEVTPEYIEYQNRIASGYSETEARILSGYNGQGSGRYSQKDKSINMRFNKAGDTIYQDINSSGCGPIAATNLINRNIKYGTGLINPKDAAKYALDRGFKETNGGTDPRYFTSYFKKNGIESSITSNRSAMRNAIKNGQQVVLMGKDPKYGKGNNTPYGPNMHYVTATGMRGNDIIIDNPELDNEYTIYDANDTINKSTKAIITNSKYGMGTDKLYTAINNTTPDKVNSPQLFEIGPQSFSNEVLRGAIGLYDNTGENSIKTLVHGDSKIGLFDFIINSNAYPWPNNTIRVSSSKRDDYEKQISEIYDLLSDKDKATIDNVIIPMIATWASTNKEISEESFYEAIKKANDNPYINNSYKYHNLFDTISKYKYDQFDDSDVTRTFGPYLQYHDGEYNSNDNVQGVVLGTLRYIDGIAKYNLIDKYARKLYDSIINSGAADRDIASIYLKTSDMGDVIYNLANKDHLASNISAPNKQALTSGFNAMSNKINPGPFPNTEGAETDRLNAAYDNMIQDDPDKLGLSSVLRNTAAALFFRIGTKMFRENDKDGFPTLKPYTAEEFNALFDTIPTGTEDGYSSSYVNDVNTLSKAVKNVYGSNYPEFLTPDGFKKIYLNYLFGSSKNGDGVLSNTDSLAVINYLLENNKIPIKVTDIPGFGDLGNNYNNYKLSSILSKIIRNFKPEDYMIKPTFSYNSLTSEEDNPLEKMMNYWESDRYNVEDALISEYKNGKKSDTLKSIDSELSNYIIKNLSKSYSDNDYDLIKRNFKKYTTDYLNYKLKQSSMYNYSLPGDAADYVGHFMTDNDIEFIKEFSKYLLNTRISTNETNYDQYRTYNDLYNDSSNTTDGAIILRNFINMTKSPRFKSGTLYSNSYEYNPSGNQVASDGDPNNKKYYDWDKRFLNSLGRFDKSVNPGSSNDKYFIEQNSGYFSIQDIMNNLYSMILGGGLITNKDGSTTSITAYSLGKSVFDRMNGYLSEADENPDPGFMSRINTFDNLNDFQKHAIMLRVLREERENSEKVANPLDVIRSGIATAGLIDDDLFKTIYLNKLFYDTDKENLPESYLKSDYINTAVGLTNSTNDPTLKNAINNINSMFSIFGNGNNYVTSNEFIKKYADKASEGFDNTIRARSATKNYIENYLHAIDSSKITASNKTNYYDDLNAIYPLLLRDVYGVTDVDNVLADKYKSIKLSDHLKSIGSNYIDLNRAKSNRFDDMIKSIASNDILVWNPNATDDFESPSASGLDGIGSKTNISETGDIIDVNGLGSELDEYMFRDITKFSPLSHEAIRTFIDKRVKNSGYGAYSPFREHISYIIELGNRYGIDPRVALAIMTTEEGLCCNEYGAKHLAKCNYISIMRSVKDDEEVGAGRMANFSTGGTRTIGGVTFNLGDAKEPTSAAGIKMGLEIVFEFLKKVSVNKRNQKSLFSLNFRPGYVFCGTLDWINTTINILKQIDALDPNTKISYVQPSTEELNYYKSLTGTALNMDCVPTEDSDSGNSFLDLLQNLAKAVFGEDLWNFFANGFGFGNTKKTAKSSKISIFDPNRRYSGLSDIFKNGLMEGTVLAPSVASGGNFGPRYLNNGLNYHMGIDMTSSNTTTPIGSPVNGDVIEAVNSNEGYGNHVIVLDDNSNGRRAHLFGHLSKINVKSGDTISQGDIIGNMGSTGMSTGPHLHYGVNIPDANNNIDYGHYNIEEKTLNGEYNDLNKNTEMTSAHPFTSLPDSAFSQNSGWVNPELYLNDYLDANNKELAKLRGTASKATPVNDYNNPENSAFSAERMKEYEHAYNTDFDWKGITASYQATDAFVASHQARMSKSGEGSGRTLADQMIIDNINENGISGIGGGDKLSTAEQARIRKAITTIKERDAAKHTSKPAYGMGSGGIGGAPNSVSTTNNATDEKLLASNNSQVELLLVISKTLKSIEETSRQNNALVAAIMEAVRRGEISTDSETYKALIRSLNNSSSGSGSDTTSVLVNSMMSIARS